jgi:hypothetical protein
VKHYKKPCTPTLTTQILKLIHYITKPTQTQQKNQPTHKRKNKRLYTQQHTPNSQCWKKENKQQQKRTKQTCTPKFTANSNIQKLSTLTETVTVKKNIKEYYRERVIKYA